MKLGQVVDPVMVANYKTTYLAEVFGVSVTAINNWIEEGRFVRYRREPNKHARIPNRKVTFPVGGSSGRGLNDRRMPNLAARDMCTVLETIRVALRVSGRLP